MKAKEGPIGQPITTEFPTAVRQFSEGVVVDSSDPIYVQVRILPTVAEPWDE